MKLTKLIFAAAALVLCTAATQPEQKKIKLFIAGDSTAQTYSPEQTLMRGWGQQIGAFFNDNVEVDNRAIGGRSTRSFIYEDRWAGIMEDIRPGDWVMIQFGHNDTSPNAQRHATPKEYKDNLKKFVTEAREKGANPIILTSIVMRTFEDGELVDRRNRFAEYIQYSRDVAEELDVPLIDVNSLTTELVRSLGDEPSKELYFWIQPGEHPRITEEKKDDTHLREKGADAYAKLITEALKEMKNEVDLGNYVK